jgi:glycosyltransferase involved in cell wall biosynthesis
MPAEKVTVTPLGLPRQFTQSREQEVERKDSILRQRSIKPPYLLYVGGYEPHKNVSGLLHTFSLVHSVRPEVSLVLVGTKTVPRGLISQAVDCGLQCGRDLFFLVDLGEELNELYDNAELFVTLSWRESFGLPALEAMSRGLRVVASMWGATPEIVGELGMLIDPRDHKGAAKAILGLLDEPVTPEWKCRLRARANEFDWSQSGRLTLNIYYQLLERAASR